MPNWWCGPRLRVPKWVAPTIAEARSSFRRRMSTLSNQESTFRRRMRTMSDNDYGSRFRSSLRRSRLSVSMRSLNRSRSEWTLRRTMSFRESLNGRRRDGGSFRRRDSTLRKRRTMTDIRIIRRSYCPTALSEQNLSTSCSGEEGSGEDIELDEMTKQADNLRREYEQMQFQEKWRDDMLLKLHQQNLELSPEEMECAAKARTFSGVKRRADSLLDQIRVLIRKFLVLAPGEPGLIEACFQIVQEEERRDEEAATCLQENGFETPDRPKKWKNKILTEFRKVPLLRVENTPQQDRGDDRNWLAKHMELMSQKLREDLKIVKGLFVACPSLDEDVAQYFIDAYYEYLAQHIQDIVSTGLRHSEIIQLLSWLTEHKVEMRRLNQCFVEGVCLIKAANSLLPEHTRKELEQSYLKTVHSNVKQWAKDALQKEREDWNGDEPPKQDKDGYLYTEFPVHLFDLLRQNLDVAKGISPGTYKALLGHCLDEVRNIVQHYAAAVKVYIPTRSVSTTPPSSPQPSPRSAQLVRKIRKTVEPHLSPAMAEERRCQLNKPKFYVQYSVATLNNFETIIEHSELFKQQCPQEAKKEGSKQVDEDEDDFMYSLNMMRRLAKECLDKFMNDLYAELKPLLKLVGSKQWLVQNGTSCIGDVCDIITNYTIQLRKRFVEDWRERLEQWILQEYTKGFSRKTVCITCKNSKERQDIAEQISWESDQIENTLATLHRDAEVHISVFNILRQMAEVIRLTDKSAIVLEASSLVLKHPELTRRQLKSILRLRGDLKKNKIKKIMINVMATDDTDSIGYCSGESAVSSMTVSAL